MSNEMKIFTRPFSADAPRFPNPCVLQVVNEAKVACGPVGNEINV
jgi:hypothetical protein